MADKLTPEQIEEMKEKANALFDQRIEECAALFGVDSAFLIKAGLTSYANGELYSIAGFHYRGLNFQINLWKRPDVGVYGDIESEPYAIVQGNSSILIHPLTLLFAMQRQINMIRRATDDNAKAAQIAFVR